MNGARGVRQIVPKLAAEEKEPDLDQRPRSKSVQLVLVYQNVQRVAIKQNANKKVRAIFFLKNLLNFRVISYLILSVS